MSTESSIKLTLAYTGTDFTRAFSMNVDDSIAADYNTIRTKVDAINASLAAGTADSLANFFLADDYDGTNGKLNRITSAQVLTIQERTIF